MIDAVEEYPSPLLIQALAALKDLIGATSDPAAAEGTTDVLRLAYDLGVLSQEDGEG